MTAPVPPPAASRPRGLRRSRTGAVLGGVCAGVARSAGLDPLLLRVALVAVTVLTVGAGALAYLVAWVLLPREAAVPATTDAVAGTGAEVSGADIPAPRSPLPRRRPAGNRVRSP